MAEATTGLEIEVAGKKTIVRMDALTGRDVKDFRGEVGFAPARAFSEPGLMDIDVIAAFLWIERRRTKPTLTYDEVLDGISYSNIKVVSDAAGDEDDPEA